MIKFGLKDKRLSGRRENFKNLINWFYSKGTYLRKLTKLVKFLQNSCEQHTLKAQRANNINVLRTVMKTLSNNTLLRWKALIVLGTRNVNLSSTCCLLASDIIISFVFAFHVVSCTVISEQACCFRRWQNTDLDN